MTALAIHGGTPVRAHTNPFPFYRTVGEEEKMAVARVIDRGILSRFLGSWHEDFYGGEEVRAFESDWARRFRVRHAIAVNSATSGLIAAVGAIGIVPGDEVIVSPYSMCISATAPLFSGGIPVFADVEESYACLDPNSIAVRITSRTKAIIVVDLFGQPYDVDAIMRLARAHHLMVIEDAAQAIGATYRGRFAGTLGDVGVYSLNCHKHIQTGEGGVVVTDDERIAERVRLIRNHAEAVVGEKGEVDLVNMVGYNFRMTEIEAAMARCQLEKLDTLIAERQTNCAYVAERLARIPAIEPLPVRPGAAHVYYVQPFRFRVDIAGVSRDRFLDAVRAELAPSSNSETFGVRLWSGYANPLYRMPLFQQRIAFGRDGYPFTLAHPSALATYAPESCPVAERLHDATLFTSDLMLPGYTRVDLNDVVAAFEKVWTHRGELQLQESHSKFQTPYEAVPSPRRQEA